jgi:hypothetical protein
MERTPDKITNVHVYVNTIYSQHAFAGNYSVSLISYTLVRAFVYCQPALLQSFMQR